MRKERPDYILIFIVAALILFGLMMIASVGSVISFEKFKDPYYFLKRQMTNLLIGLFLAYVVYKINYKIWFRFAFPLFFISLVLLALVFAPGLSYGIGEAKRWIKIGSFSFQPAEMLKLTLIIYLSAWWSRLHPAFAGATAGKQEYGGQNSFIPFLCLMAIIGVLIIKQPDIGTLGVIALTAISIYFLAGAKLSYLFLLGIGGIVSFLYLIKTAAYRTNRWITFLHPEIDPQGIGYQINQALLAMGSGGLLGLGLGQSKQKYNFLPEPITDSITAVIGEELGYIGLTVLIILFLIFIFRGLKICKNAPDNFAKLLSGGIISLISIQVFIHFTAICGLIPLTGLPLPFISYGGSSLITNLISVGILLNISKSEK